MLTTAWIDFVIDFNIIFNRCFESIFDPTILAANDPRTTTNDKYRFSFSTDFLHHFSWISNAFWQHLASILSLLPITCSTVCFCCFVDSLMIVLCLVVYFHCFVGSGISRNFLDFWCQFVQTIPLQHWPGGMRARALNNKVTNDQITKN